MTDPAALRFGAAFWVQRADWASLREAAVLAEASGFSSLWIDDHLLNDEGDPDEAKLEGWTTLAALAAVTERARLGLLVGANGLRNPGLVAKMAVTLDEISGGRAVLGLGAGWFEREYAAFGIPFGASAGERIDRLDESAGLLRRLFDGERVTHAGRFYAFDDAIVRPRPVQARLPILIGGSGRKRTLRVVARHADLWNGYGDPAELRDAQAALDAHCAEVGRDPASIARTATQNVVIRATAETAAAEFRAISTAHAIQPGEETLDLSGPPETIAAGLRGWADAGISEVIWVFRMPWDLETIRSLPAVRALLGA